MANKDEFFDDKSGISIEEQREILSTINGIAEKNRRQLSQSKTEAPDIKTNAKKNGAFFPLAFNIAAVLVLCGGALLLVSFNVKTDAQARTGSAVYYMTERALIEEIRKDTAEKIAAKDVEIASIASLLDEIDAQLLLLNSGDLTSEQMGAQSRLLFLHNSYSEEMALLQEERSLILENSRSREAALRVQLEERMKEFSDVQQRTSAELDAATLELEKLSDEQAKISTVEDYLAGALASVNTLVKDGEYEKVSQTVAGLRQFLNNNSVASSRRFQARREFYNQAFNLVETMIDGRGVSVTQNASGSGELQEKNSQLEQTIAEMQKTIDAFSSGSSGQAQRLGELEETVTSLRSSVSSLETGSAEKDRTIASMESEKTSLSQTIAALQDDNSAKDQDIANLRNQIAAIRELLTNQQ